MPTTTRSRGAGITAQPLAWRPAALGAGALAWDVATWPALTAWCGLATVPAYYDYGNTVVYQGDNVYISGTDVATAEEYSQQATAIASAAREPKAPADKWQSLGVFALVQGDEKTSNNLFELAVDQAGIIRGNSTTR